MNANHQFRGLHGFPITAIRAILPLVLGWHLAATPASATIGTASLTSTGPNSATLTFSHTDFQANAFPFGVAQTYKYRVCFRQLNQIGLACMYNALNTNSQTVELTGLTVGLPINITIQCWCRRQINAHLYGLSSDRIVADMNYTHQLPPPVPGLVSSSNVRVRGLQSNQCLYINLSSDALVHGWSCWADPAMVFALESFSNGTNRLRHVQTNRCITAIGPGTVLAQPCGGNESLLAILPQAGPGSPVHVRFLFAHSGWPFAGGQFGTTCLVANSANGQSATRHVCNSSGLELLMLDPA